MLKKLKSENGSVSIIVALSLTVLLAFSALTVDLGRVAMAKQSMQNALDSACLAGVQNLPNSTTVAEQKAIDYFVANGYDEADIQSVEFYDNNKQIRMTAKNNIEYTFAKVFDNGDSTDVNIAAAAEISSVLDTYDYAIFSGSGTDLLQFKGQNNITGDVHSNDTIKNAATINGNVTAVNSIDAKVTATTKTAPAPAKKMPDFSGVEAMATPISGTTLASYGATYDSKKDQYSMSSTQLNTLLNSHSNILITGNLVVNGSDINAIGSVITTGSITCNGGKTSMTSNNKVCFYSKYGNITLNGSTGSMNGVLYSPNGSVTLNGNGSSFYGSIIGQTVSCDGGINLVYQSDVSNTVPPTVIRLVE